jgi:hypothetical protein
MRIIAVILGIVFGLFFSLVLAIHFGWIRFAC